MPRSQLPEVFFFTALQALPLSPHRKLKIDLSGRPQISVCPPTISN